MNTKTFSPCANYPIPRYTALRTEQALPLDGRLEHAAWQNARKSESFRDLVHATPSLYDTRVAVLWDDNNLYVAYWIEEPQITAFQTERDSLIYEDNDVELFIAGDNGYYEFEINAFGTIYEVFFLWEDSYEKNAYQQRAEFDLHAEGVEMFDGVGYRHPRGKRLGFWNWDYPGLRSAVHIDGNINDPTTRDRGWRVELALPWAGLTDLADGRSLPPQDGDIWRMDFSRFNQYKAAPPAVDSSGWALSPHGVWDSHIPECFAIVQFSTQAVQNP